MSENSKIITIFLSVPLIAVTIIYLVSGVTFSLSFSAEEQKVFNFNYEQIPQFSHREKAQVASIQSPIDLPQSAERGYPKATLAEIAPPPDAAGNRVSFILIHKKRNLAIVDGKVVREGSFIGNHKIAKIEKDKILLKSREGEKWLKLD